MDGASLDSNVNTVWLYKHRARKPDNCGRAFGRLRFIVDIGPSDLNDCRRPILRRLACRLEINRPYKYLFFSLLGFGGGEVITSLPGDSLGLAIACRHVAALGALDIGG